AGMSWRAAQRDIAMKHPIDVETRVSAELSRFIEGLVNDPDREEPPTLKDVQSALSAAANSGILIDGELLVDLGELAYLDYLPGYIFIMHLHADHVAFMDAHVEITAQVYVPEPTSRLPAAHVISGPVHVGSFKVIPVPTIHSNRTHSVGYVVETKGRRLFYSSDMVSIEPQYQRRLRHLDLVITDGSYMRKGGLVRIDPNSGGRYGHAGIPDLVEFFRPLAKHILITHFGSWFYKDIETSIRKVEALSDAVHHVVAAYDGLTISI
ncbi:MAG: MBL fold metallo-hydrolase, partial [Burkholderiales bacterium]